MPLVKSCSIVAFEQNIAAELRAGKPREQAVAIANRTLRDACRSEDKPVPTRKAIEVVRKQQTTDIQVLVMSKAKFKTRDSASAWASEHEFKATNVRETGESWRVQQRDSGQFVEGTFKTIEMDDGVDAVIGRPTHKVAKAKRERTKEFLESAFERARKVLNPRDFAVIFQAARASAGGQISAKRRKERISAAEKQLVEKTPLKEMSKAELADLNQSLNNAYDRAEKAGGSLRRVISRAESLRQEYRRRGIGDPDGSAHKALKKRGKEDVRKQRLPIHTKVLTALRNGSMKKPGNCSKCRKTTESNNLMSHHTDYEKALDVQWLCRACHGAAHVHISKGFTTGRPDGGMHAHGLDRRNSKTMDDGGHLHSWVIPGTGEVVLTSEDGCHQHEITGGEAGGCSGPSSARR